MSELCLAYINSNNQWICESNVESETNYGPNYVQGSTNHFTTFAIVTGNKNNNPPAISFTELLEIVISIGVFFLIICCIVLILVIYVKRRNKKTAQALNSGNLLKIVGPLSDSFYLDYDLSNEIELYTFSKNAKFIEGKWKDSQVVLEKFKSNLPETETASIINEIL